MGHSIHSYYYCCWLGDPSGHLRIFLIFDYRFSIFDFLIFDFWFSFAHIFVAHMGRKLPLSMSLSLFCRLLLKKMRIFKTSLIFLTHKINFLSRESYISRIYNERAFQRYIIHAHYSKIKLLRFFSHLVGCVKPGIITVSRMLS